MIRGWPQTNPPTRDHTLLACPLAGAPRVWASLYDTPRSSCRRGGRLSRFEPATSPGPAFWNKSLPFFFPNPHFLRYWLLQWQVYPSLLSNRAGQASQELGFWFVPTPWDSLGWSRWPRQHAGAHWALLKLAARTDQYVMTQHYNG